MNTTQPIQVPDLFPESDPNLECGLDSSTDVSSGPAAPLFAGVPEPLRDALEKRGFTVLTSIQLAAIEAVDSGRDLRISSQTGSGKTVAIGIAMSPALLGPPTGPGPGAIVIAPTRELAGQVRDELAWLYAGAPGVRVDCVTGGTPIGGDRRKLARNPRILVGTPGRLLDHIRAGVLDCSAVAQVVLDEADQMLDMGFREELEAILAVVPAERHMHMVSATFPPGIRHLAERYQSAALHVEGTQLGAANADIEHVAHIVRPDQRYDALVNLLLLSGDERVLVFLATRADVARVAERLDADGFAALPLSGELQQAQRTRTVAAFRGGKASILVATDVAARGLDVPDVACVIHAEVPMDGEVYTHRSGRTGRAGNKGKSVVLVPHGGRRRVERILREARVEARWCDAPSADEVGVRLRERMQAHVTTELERGEGANADYFDLARQLLEDRDPVQVAATLLQLAAPRAGAQPRALEVPTGHAQEWIPPGRGGRRPQRAVTRYFINWGFKAGANPKRLLAHICRRGDVQGKSIGAFDLGPFGTTFDVDSSAADAFEKRAKLPDARDPHLRIERARPAGGKGSYGKKPFKPFKKAPYKKGPFKKGPSHKAANDRMPYPR
ncbi:MAG: DEAD/DEAH box helicase [bacterium]|nr:DEAD/DEAH box helicase [bacterium]